MDIHTYAVILLVIRIASMILMGLVIKRQLELFRLRVPQEIKLYRVILFVLALGIFIGNITPAIIDVLTIFGDVDRSARIVKPISLLYTIDAAGTALLSSILIFWLYRMSNAADEKFVDSDHILMNNDK